MIIGINAVNIIGFLRSNQRLVIDIKSSVIARQEPLKFVVCCLCNLQMLASLLNHN